MNRLLFFALLTLFLATPASISRSKPQVFKTKVNWVYLTVTVTDRDGRSVRGLPREDFEVYEDGLLQEIKFFSAERRPISLTLLIDVSGSMSDKFGEMRDAVLHVLDNLGEEDTIHVVLFSHDIEVLKDVQERKQEFVDALGRVKLSGGTRLYDSVGLSLRELGRVETGRKGIIALSDGKDTASRTQLKSFLRQVRESDFPIYTLGIGHFSNRGLLSRIFGAGHHDPEVNEVVLKRIAEVTGGRFFKVAGEHQKGGRDVIDYYCQLILDELKSQYLIAYEPNNPVQDGKWREIKVKVKGKKNTLRTRSGYYPTG